MENRQTLSNADVYKKVLTFSIRRFVFCCIYVAMLVLLGAGGFILADRFIDGEGAGLVGMGVGVVIAIVLIAIIAHFFAYTIKAGMIAVMTKSITEDRLPDNAWQEGKQAVKERFATVALYYAATSVIKGIFGELGRAITKVGGSLGGDAGETVGSAISTVINTIINYLCDCCLGWVFYRKEQNAFKATCEGAVIFFKHGKTFLKNMGRIFGMGLATLVVIGGIFGGIGYAVLTQFPTAMHTLAKEISELKAEDNQQIINFLSNPTNLTIALAAIIGIIMWSILHGTFVKPFVLVGVMRNYLNSAVADIPDQSEFSILEKHSSKYKKYKKQYADQL